MTTWYTWYTELGTKHFHTLQIFAPSKCSRCRTKNVPNGWYRLLLFPDSLLCSLPCSVYSLHPSMDCTYQALVWFIHITYSVVLGGFVLHMLHLASKLCAACGTEKSVPEACLALCMWYRVYLRHVLCLSDQIRPSWMR